MSASPSSESPETSSVVLPNATSTQPGAAGAVGRARLAEAVLDNLKEVVFQTDQAGNWVFLNPAWEALSGRTVADSIGRNFQEFVLEEDRAPNRALLGRLLREGKPVCRHEIRYLNHSDIRWVEVFAQQVLSKDGEVVGTCGTLNDVTERKQHEERMRLAASVFKHAGEGIVITAPDGTIVEVNSAFEKITGYSREEAIGRDPSMLNSGRQPKAFYDEMWKTLDSAGYWQGEVWNRHKSGELYVERLTITRINDERGRAVNFIGLFSDITAQTLQAQDLERIAHYDPLTGLPNRRLLAVRLQHAMAQARRRGTKVAVAYLDLDGFKAVNDELGHKCGDELLIALGARMMGLVRECDVVSRLGGDEFVVVIDDVKDVLDCLPLIRRILEAICQPVHLDGHVARVSASIGIALYADGAEVDADQLMRQADQAMYKAKMQGKNCYVIFGDGHDNGHSDEVALLHRIADGLVNHEFELHYQPIVHLQTGELNSVEALIRWKHPQRGLLSPAEFLPVVQGHPLAISVDNWVLDEALRQHQEWLAGGLDVAISVNMSAAYLHQGDFTTLIRSKLAAHPAVKRGRIKLEVLETSALDDIAHVSRTISECAELGVPFALDDFGTGYSSLLYLKQLPAKRIKIDQGFVRDMLVDADDLAILEGVLGMGAAFKREVVAEGVETIEHARMLVQMGCVMGQGYGIARPMPARQLGDWARGWRLPAELRGCRVLDRESSRLLVAGVEHQGWIKALTDHVRDPSQPLPPMERDQCRLGKWIERASANIGTGCDTLTEAMNLHREIHASAEAMVAALDRAGSVPESGIQELIRLGSRLLEALDRLIHESAD